MLRRLLLVGAFVFCAIGVFGLLNNNDKSEPASVAAVHQEKQVQVWRARRTLTGGERVTRQDLEAAMITPPPGQNQQKEQPTLTLLKPGAIARESIIAGTRVTDLLLVTPGDPDYINHLIKPGMIPYPLTINGSNYQSVLASGDRVDVVMIASLEQNLANNAKLSGYRGFSIGPLLSGLRVLAVQDAPLLDTGKKDSTVILELSRDQVSRILVARRIGQLDIHKSTGVALPTVRTGDVLPGYSSVTELRGAERQVN